MNESTASPPEAWESYEGSVRITPETCVLHHFLTDCDGDAVRIAQPSEDPGILIAVAAVLGLSQKSMSLAVPKRVSAKFRTTKDDDES